MPAKEKVSLKIQTIFCIIPILDMYAAYRIKKLRKYLLIMILLVAVPVTIISSVIFPSEEDLMEGFVNVATYYYGVDQNEFIFSVVVQIGSILIAIFLIRRWSHQWNFQFD